MQAQVISVAAVAPGGRFALRLQFPAEQVGAGVSCLIEQSIDGRWMPTSEARGIDAINRSDAFPFPDSRGDYCSFVNTSPTDAASYQVTVTAPDNNQPRVTVYIVDAAQAQANDAL